MMTGMIPLILTCLLRMLRREEQSDAVAWQSGRSGALKHSEATEDLLAVDPNRRRERRTDGGCYPW
jgi:hypothetical protein